MKVRITPARGYAHGHIETLLIQIGITPPAPRHPEGLVIMDLTEAQIATFQLKGNAHRVERLPEAEAAGVASAAPAPDPTPAPVSIPAPNAAFVSLQCPICDGEFNVATAMLPQGAVTIDCVRCGALLMLEGRKIVGSRMKVPTLQLVTAAGYSDEAAAKIVARQQDMADWVAAGKNLADFPDRNIKGEAAPTPTPDPTPAPEVSPETKVDESTTPTPEVPKQDGKEAKGVKKSN